MGVSTRTKDMGEGGGLFASEGPTKGEVIGARYCQTGMRDVKYKTSGKPSVLLELTVRDEEGAEHTLYHSGGDLTAICPSDDGTSLEAAKDGAKLSRSSNLGIFFASLEAAGFHDAVGDPGDNAELMVGQAFLFERIPAPERKGLQINRPGQESSRPQTVIIVKELLEQEEAEEAPKAKAKGGAKKQAGDPVKEAAIALVTEAIEASEDGLKRKEIASAVNRLAMKDKSHAPLRSKIIALLDEDDFYEEVPGLSIGKAGKYTIE